MRRVIACAILIAAPLLAGGCARGNVELLEARLRTREEEILALESELSRTREELTNFRRERDYLQQQLIASQQSTAALEVSRRLSRIESLSIDQRLTGFVTATEAGEPPKLNLLFAPVDASGEPVKLEGRTTIELFDFSTVGTGGEPRRWTFSAGETAERWHSGFIGEGFQFELPAGSASAAAGDLLIRVSFETPDGRRFSATHELSPSPLSNEPPPVPRSPVGDEPLPLPQASYEPLPSALSGVAPASFSVEHPATAGKPLPFPSVK